LAKYQGCPIPDTDGDGINDEEDKCPNTAGLARYQGCPIPDKDADGINDEEDKCPDQPGVARYQGCPIPDRDGDGVNDEEDRCPDVAGIVSNYGCPEVKFKPENITFGTGSAVLTKGGVKELTDQVLPGIKALDTKYRLEIHGHTDNTGNAKLNQTLSEKRAASVKAWLVKNGIDASRLDVKGFGDTQPVADNKTTAGRAKNRRVDFKLLN
jgi:outer membrane protein OmpA-like peptidoglycan-associated protein